MAILYYSTSETVIANTASEITMFPDIVTIPANESTASIGFLVDIRGFYYTTLVPPTIRLRLKLGSTVIADTTALTAPVANVTGHIFNLNAELYFTAVGASGVALAQGRVLFTEDSTVVPKVFQLAVEAGVTVNTSVSNVLSATAQWGTASILNSIVSKKILVEYHGAVS